MGRITDNNTLYILLFGMLFSTACGKGDKQENTGVILTSPTFPEIKAIRENITATVKVGDKICELTIDSDTTLSGKCDALDFNTYSYTIEYRDNQYQVLLASTSGTVIIEAGGYQRFELSPLDKNFDKDADGFTNLNEVVTDSDPTNADTKPRQVAQIQINQTDVAVEAGKTTQLTWTVKDNNNADYSTVPLAWTSSNDQVAMVSLAGVVSGIKNGSAEIVAKDTFSGNQASVMVSVSGDSGELPESLKQGLVAYYPFNGNARDESGNLNDCIVNGSTLSDDRFGNSNSAYSFDGVNDFINCGHSIDFNINNHSIVAWIYKNDASDGYIVGKSNPKVYESIGLRVVDNKLSTAFATGSEPYHEVDGNTTLGNDFWYFVGITYDGLRVKFFVNGALDSETARIGVPRSNENPLAIGRHSGDIDPFPVYFNGTIDDIGIYNRALTEEEIKALYHKGGWSLE